MTPDLKIGCVQHDCAECQKPAQPLSDEWLRDQWSDALRLAYRDDEGEAFQFFARAIERRIKGEVTP